MTKKIGKLPNFLSFEPLFEKRGPESLKICPLAVLGAWELTMNHDEIYYLESKF